MLIDKPRNAIDIPALQHDKKLIRKWNDDDERSQNLWKLHSLRQ